MKYHAMIFNTIDTREGTTWHAQCAAQRFSKLNGCTAQVVTRADFATEPNPYWYPAWLWDVAPEDAEYVIYFDSKVLPIRPLPRLPELKFAAALDRRDRINQGCAASTVMQQTGKYFQMHLFVAHRDTQPFFEQLKPLNDDPRYGAHSSIWGADGRGIFTPLNEVIQANVPVHELPRSCNWLIAFEKQYYYDWPHMINFNGRETETWAYLKYVRGLVEYIEKIGGSMDG